MSRPASKKGFRYKHLLIAYCVLLGVFLLSFTPLFGIFADFIRKLGLLGVFLGGMLYISTFTFSAGLVSLVVLAPMYNPLLVVAIAAAGAVTGDFLIFRFVRDDLEGELWDLYTRFGGKYISKVFKLKIFSWILPVLGAIVVASPFPDEIGVSLMGISDISTKRFIAICYTLNAIGIFGIVVVSDLLVIAK